LNVERSVLWRDDVESQEERTERKEKEAKEKDAKEARWKKLEEGIEELSENSASKIFKALVSDIGEEKMLDKLGEHFAGGLLKRAVKKWRIDTRERVSNRKIEVSIRWIAHKVTRLRSVTHAWRLAASRRQYKQETMAQVIVEAEIPNHNPKP